MCRCTRCQTVAALHVSDLLEGGSGRQPGRRVPRLDMCGMTYSVHQFAKSQATSQKPQRMQQAHLFALVQSLVWLHTLASRTLHGTWQLSFLMVMEAVVQEVEEVGGSCGRICGAPTHCTGT